MRQVAIHAFGHIGMGSVVPVFVSRIHDMTVGAGPRGRCDISRHIRDIDEHRSEDKETSQAEDHIRRFESGFHASLPDNDNELALIILKKY